MGRTGNICRGEHVEWGPVELEAHPAWVCTHHPCHSLHKLRHLKLVQWVWETFLALKLLKAHTSHSSECILGSHSLILQHMQTHIRIPTHEYTHSEIKRHIQRFHLNQNLCSSTNWRNHLTFHLTLTDTDCRFPLSEPVRGSVAWLQLLLWLWCNRETH